MTYEEIKKANESITTMTLEKKNKKTGEITKKEYAEVNQRIKAFRMIYPEGFILTELVSNNEGVCVMRAKVGYYANGSMIILGTGTAYEKESSSYINETSFIENCETSCVGRALGMLALGIDTSVASYEEVQNAVNNQKPEKEEPKRAGTVNALTKKEITLMAAAAKTPMEEILSQAGVKTIDEMSQRTAEMVRMALQRKIQNMAQEAKKNGAEGQTA